jgi:hypothetical protein
LTSDFDKSDVIWIMKQSALCVSGKADGQQQLRWSRKPGTWRFTHESNSNKRLMGTCMRVFEVTWEGEENKCD